MHIREELILARMCRTQLTGVKPITITKSDSL